MEESKSTASQLQTAKDTIDSLQTDAEDSELRLNELERCLQDSAAKFEEQQLLLIKSERALEESSESRTSLH